MDAGFVRREPNGFDTIDRECSRERMDTSAGGVVWRSSFGFNEKSPLQLSSAIMYMLAYLMEHSREFVVFHIADAVKPKQMEVRRGYSVARPHR